MASIRTSSSDTRLQSGQYALCCNGLKPCSSLATSANLNPACIRVVDSDDFPQPQSPAWAERLRMAKTEGVSSTRLPLPYLSFAVQLAATWLGALALPPTPIGQDVVALLWSVMGCKLLYLSREALPSMNFALPICLLPASGGQQTS